MTTNEIIAEYDRARVHYNAVMKRVDRHFTPQVNRALKKGNIALARKIGRLIPCSVCRAFAFDAIRQAVIKQEGSHS
jgi:RNase P subunit RPR2